ncbi:putative RND superfamily exporter [Spongiibacter sp. IMCC21906]|uniref:efflux RND transporter permease subunit n=1 Tax=Spongiibacter sp. IMCC21906 TaxID=1620392 RepID=UPI00062DF45D|nr:MMPL family transporter [Spongiibacter sp. IMCC21906]AKH69379.1 putative RND superfamily exporter [Spongiibacter sp. IMCC21906]
MAFLIKRPFIIIAVFLVAVIALGLQSKNFEINASADTLISEGNRDFIRSQKINQEFAPEEFLILAYKPDSGDIFSPKSQQDVAAISQRLQSFKRVEAVRSILSVPLLQAGADTLSADTDPSKLTQAKLKLSPAELKKIFKNHPIYEGLLVNPEQTVSGIQVLFKEHPELARLEREQLALQEKQLDAPLSEAQSQQLVSLKEKSEGIKKTLREQRSREIDLIRKITNDYADHTTIYLGGVHVLAYQLINIIQSDLLIFGSAIAATIALLMLLIFRSFRWLFITACCCASTLFITLGSFALLGLKATVISANFIALLLILSLAIVIHLIVQYREESQADPDADKQTLVEKTLANKLAPCFFAGLTTSVGFASLMLSNIEPVSAFGLMMMLAMGITLVSTLLLFPALLLLFPKEAPRKPSTLFQKPLKACSDLSLNKGYLVIFAGAGILVLSVIGAMKLNVENSFINYFREGAQIHKELQFIDQDFGGSTPLDLIYTPETAQNTASSKLPLSAKQVQNTHRIQDMLDQQTAMGTTLSVVNFTQLAKNINGGRPLTEYELAAVYWTLDESIREDLLGSFFIDSPPRLRISARIQDSTEGLNRQQLLQDIKNGMAELGIPEDQYQLSNLFVLYQAMLQQLFDSQILTLGAVFAALTLVFWVVFRSLRVAVLSMVPNILAAMSILGLMGWLGIPLDFMTMTIAAIAMGIAVDDTIHYTHRYLAELKSQTPEQAARNTQHSVGFALIYTTTIIALGFALMMGSDFLPSVMFGGLTAAAVIIALLADLTLLPALLRHWGPKGNKARA